MASFLGGAVALRPAEVISLFSMLFCTVSEFGELGGLNPSHGRSTSHNQIDVSGTSSPDLEQNSGLFLSSVVVVVYALAWLRPNVSVLTVDMTPFGAATAICFRRLGDAETCPRFVLLLSVDFEGFMVYFSRANVSA